MTIAPPTARLLLLSLALAACAAEEGDIIDVEISASDPNGKADAIDGKQIRLRMHGRLMGWTRNEEPLARTRTDKVRIDAATNETVVATGTAYVFLGTDNHALVHSQWEHNRLLSLSVEKKTEGEHRLGFLLSDVFTSDSPMICKRGDLRLNFFEDVVINIADRELYANGEHTFTFAECGIDPDGARASNGPDRDVPQWMFDAFVVPLATAGRLEGTYNYDLKTELL